MNQVRPRARKTALTLAAVTKARETQGKFAMRGLESALEAGAGVVGKVEAGGAARRSDDFKPMPYRRVLASWPVDWRERWGRRANELEESGLSWRDAEGRAFVETWSEFRASGQTERN